MDRLRRRPIPPRAARRSTTSGKMAFIHSLFTFIGDTDVSGRPLAGNRVGCSPLLLEKVQTTGTEFAVAMALNRSFRLQRLLFCLALLWFPGTGAQHNTRTRRRPPPRYPRRYQIKKAADRVVLHGIYEA